MFIQFYKNNIINIQVQIVQKAQIQIQIKVQIQIQIHRNTDIGNLHQTYVYSQVMIIKTLT